MKLIQHCTGHAEWTREITVPESDQQAVRAMDLADLTLYMWEHADDLVHNEPYCLDAEHVGPTEVSE